MKTLALTALAILASTAAASAQTLSASRVNSIIRSAESRSRGCAADVRSRGASAFDCRNCQQWEELIPDYNAATDAWFSNCVVANRWSNSQCARMTENVGKINANYITIIRAY